MAARKTTSRKRAERLGEAESHSFWPKVEYPRPSPASGVRKSDKAKWTHNIPIAFAPDVSTAPKVTDVHLDELEGKLRKRPSKAFVRGLQWSIALHDHMKSEHQRNTPLKIVRRLVKIQKSAHKTLVAICDLTPADRPLVRDAEVTDAVSALNRLYAGISGTLATFEESELRGAQKKVAAEQLAFHVAVLVHMELGVEPRAGKGTVFAKVLRWMNLSFGRLFADDVSVITERVADRYKEERQKEYAENMISFFRDSA